jgi:hypothetical protein
MTIGAVAALLGEYPEAAVVIVLYVLGERLRISVLKIQNRY